jgi:hypothetical protein
MSAPAAIFIERDHARRQRRKIPDRALITPGAATRGVVSGPAGTIEVPNLFGDRGAVGGEPDRDEGADFDRVGTCRMWGNGS